MNNRAMIVKFGKQLRKLRKKHHMTLKEFAKEIDVSPKMLIQIEVGWKSASMKTLAKICDTFDISAAYFI